MFGRNQPSDKELLKTVNQRLTRASSSQSRISVAVRQGIVTVTGNLQQAHQRDPIVKALARIAGVRRVVDQLVLVVKKKVQ